MRKNFIIGTLACVFGLMTACNNNQTATDGGDEATSEREIVYNDKIQDTFFGVPFGSTGEDVEAGFNKAGLHKTISSTAKVYFFEPYSSKFSFGGLTWDYLRTEFSGDGAKNDGKFYSIQFCSAYKTKEGALSDFNGVMNALSHKYTLTKIVPTDTSTYKMYVGQTINNQVIIVSCSSYESFGHERWIGIELNYSDYSYEKVSDEL